MSEKPPEIKKSIESGNKKHLSAAGRKGAEVANRNRDIHKTLAEIREQERIMEDEAQRRSANEHIISPDNEDQDYSFVD